MPGVKVERDDLDQAMGAAAVKLREAFASALKVNGYLGRVGKPALIDQAGVFKYTEAEADDFLAVFGRLSALSELAAGGQPPEFPFQYLAGLENLTGLR